MPLTFNMLLRSEGIDPREVRLLRHAKSQGTPGMSHLVAWREHRPLFERYQSTQPARDRSFFGAPFWASFVATPDKATLFVGLYRASRHEDELAAFECPLTRLPVPDRHADLYSTEPDERLAPFAGKLFVYWGPGTRSWGQRAERQDKPIIELRQVQSEPEFPGFGAFLCQLSQVEALPASWRAILGSARGVYLLTCPKTKEQYVGAAFAGGGFLARWSIHAGMNGDALAFRSRDPEDYRVGILEVAGSLATDDDIVRMEQRWKEKLQSREMGLNRN